MPKVLILSMSESPDVAAAADAVAAGASRVRFMEVERRVVTAAAKGSITSSARALDSIDQLRDMDGVVFVAGGDENKEGDGSLLATMRGTGGWADHVFAVAGPGSAEILASVVALGGILVTVPDAQHAEESLGGRVATVIGWVRHALMHEREGSHAHGHTHSHAHGHGHGHQHSH